MAPKHKPLAEQVVVITGGSSGIGLVTARLAAERGAKVVLCSRDETDLDAAAARLREAGAEVEVVVADVADRDALERVAERAVERFGGIDTWVNNAGVSIYGRIEEVTEDDARRLFETNYWGVVHGSLVAIPHLRRRGGGALVNVGSVLSDTAMPLQGHYTASKHAVKGFTDALRIELEHQGDPITVSLVKPAAIDTPYTEHARNYLEVEPTHAPPVYAPELVAEAILSCARRGLRDVKVGGSAKFFTTTETLVPRLGDRMKGSLFSQQRSDRPAAARDTLHALRPGDARERGRYDGRVLERSAFAAAARRPGVTTSAVLGVAAVGVGLLAARAFMHREQEGESFEGEPSRRPRRPALLGPGRDRAAAAEESRAFQTD